MKPLTWLFLAGMLSGCAGGQAYQPPNPAQMYYLQQAQQNLQGIANPYGNVPLYPAPTMQQTNCYPTFGGGMNCTTTGF